jgi:16S rRNA (cytidine1402-2'-O)-methyltransferase
MKRPAKQKKSSTHSLPGGSESGDSKGSAVAGKQQEHLGNLAAGLYLVATPIGHARDVSLRALDVLKAADLVAAEDTRVTAKLFAIHGITRPLIPYNDHNGATVRPGLLEKLKAGARIALVSDAGTPLVSDPGFKLVREALAQGIVIHAIPGASAVLAGLTLSGLPSDRFLFAGFLPARAGERERALTELRAVPATLIFFESGPRLGESLAAMADVLGAREAVMAREMTKFHEEVRRGPLKDLASHYARAGAPKGEVTLLVGPPPVAEADLSRIDTALETALAFMPLKPASEMISALTGVPRRKVYDRGLEKKNAQS